jgi:putative transposase
MDVFTRSMRGWCLSRTLDQNLTLYALQQALDHDCPEIHHSDQDIHYAFKNYIQALKDHQVQISMAGVGKPEENGYAERLMRTIKEEEVELSEYNGLDDAREQIGRFLEDVYMTKRIHSALNYLTPAEFEARWQQSLSHPLAGCFFCPTFRVHYSRIWGRTGGAEVDCDIHDLQKGEMNGGRRCCLSWG